ncbi:MAG TPA: TIGR01457 family HAD-type hydrolase [Bacillota bacterium]|nr:TIGR01457 family HAD-type hydrolase [Bacillota bacterium]
MKKYTGYLIDLDGTIYCGNEVIDGAISFINYLNQSETPYVFVTNNSSKTEEEVVNHLKGMGIETTKNHILTSSIAAAKYIKRQFTHPRCFVIGEHGLKRALQEEAIERVNEEANVVVVGLDREITYEKLTEASLMIRAGAAFISTNKDAAIPTPRGFEVGNGAMTAAIQTSTNVQPTFIGKPEKIIMEEAVHMLGIDRSQLLMIGDNYETDIQAGIQSNIDTLMVYTGVTGEDEYDSLRVKPTYALRNLHEFLHAVKEK